MGLLDALGLELPQNRQAKGGGTPKMVGNGSDVAPVTAQSKVFTDYAAERAAVKKLVDGLKAHSQASRISSDLAKIAAKMDSAGQNALKAQWPAAMKDLADARALCVAAKNLADEWQKYLKKRANVLSQSTAFVGLEDAISQSLKGSVTAADAKAAASPPKFVEAHALLDAGYASAKPTFQAKINGLKNALVRVQAMPAAVQTYLAAPIAEGKALVTKAEAALAAEDWSQALINWSTGWDVIGGLERYGTRRVAYETQRATTLTDIQAVKAAPETSAKGANLDTMLAIADDLATLDKLKLEEGAKVLVAASKRCAALKIAAPIIASYRKERAAAEAELDALSKDPAAPKLAAPLESVRQLLAAAKASADKALTNELDPTPAWQAAFTTVLRARADATAAKKLATALGSSAAAQTAAGSGDVGAMKKALAALKADIATASAAPFANLVKKPLEKATGKAADAEKALGRNDAKGGAKELFAASEALSEARTMQSQHADFVSTLGSVEAKLKSLQALPTATAIAARIDVVAKAVDEAKKQDKAGAAQDAMAALRRAIDASAAAEAADRARTAYDAEAKRVGARVKAEVADANLAKSLTKNVDEETRKLADAFRFDEAGAALKRVEVEIGKAKLNAGMKATPPDPNLKAIAAEMVSKGGGSAVDAAIQSSPDGSSAAILALAEGRFGVPFKFEGANIDADSRKERIKSMKTICAMFAKIPEDVSRNPSIKDVSHADAVGGAGGGYTSSSAHIGMQGRVGAFDQEFGNNEVNGDPKTGTKVKALPADIEPDCKPKPGKVEYLGFAAAHEVGHGVDDKRGFMAKNGGGAKYGGWITYGTSVQPVADAVGAQISGKFPTSSFYKTPASKQYVLDKIMSKPAERPHFAAGSEDFKALDAFDLWHAMATANDVYRRQSDCDAIKVGDRIYHEAYPRQWVSYLADARKKGLTGYQFRSPAEWFAELYAGWKSEKLGPKHPALEWLTKL